MRRFVCFALVSLPFLTSERSLPAAEFEIEFSGTVINVFGDPFGAGIMKDDPIFGRVLYRTQSESTHPIAGCDCLGYRHQLASGFSATFGSTTVRGLDDYVVEIRNNIPQSTPTRDTFSIRYSGSYNPALESPLIVNGAPYGAAAFHVNLDGPLSSFPGPILPDNPNFSGFTSMFDLLDEVTSDIPIGVLFKITAITVEPVVPGDYEGDEDVDLDDYVRWRTEYGSVASLDADGNRNGSVDAADYTVWRDNFASTVVSSDAVPEPSTAHLLLLGFMACSLFDARGTVHDWGC